MRKKTEAEIIKQLKDQKKEALNIAEQLGYFKYKGIKESLKEAKSIAEINRIMHTCRDYI